MTSTDEDMFVFDEPEGAMTMTIDPLTHYSELRALAELLKWAETKITEGVLGEEDYALYEAAVDLREAYAANEPM